MDQFEAILGTLLRADGYWVWHSYKVNLTPEEKRAIGKPSMPRPEIDLLALKFSSNTILALEAKSYFDSGGVSLSSLMEVHTVPEGRYKLFTSDAYREIVFHGLLRQLIENGMANSNTTIKLGLAAGRIYRNEADQVSEYMNSRGWSFWSPTDVKDKLQALAQKGYENDAAIMTAKILLN